MRRSSKQLLKLLAARSGMAGGRSAATCGAAAFSSGSSVGIGGIGGATRAAAMRAAVFGLSSRGFAAQPAAAEDNAMFCMQVGARYRDAVLRRRVERAESAWGVFGVALA